MVETEELPGTVLVEAQSPTSKTEGNASMETLSCFVKGFGRYHPKPSSAMPALCECVSRNPKGVPSEFLLRVPGPARVPLRL